MKRWLAGAAVLLGLAVTGCAADPGGDGVATAGGPAASPTASAGLDDAERARQFARCMREHGVDMPDPGEGDRGAVVFRADKGEKGKLDTAMRECRQYAPNGGEPVKLSPADLEKMRQLARCMRENGVPDFPDPDADGAIKMTRRTGADPGEEKFKAAHEKCEQFAPHPPGLAGASGGKR